MTSEQFVERLREWADEPIGDYMDHVQHADTLMRAAADEITRLQEALAAAEAERDRLIEWKTAIIDLCRALGSDDMPWGGDKSGWGFIHYFVKHLHTRAITAETRIAETRKKALEEAAQIAENTVDFHDDGLSTFDAAQIIAAAIRSLSAEEAKP